MATISQISRSFFSIKWRFVAIYLVVVALVFTAVALVVVRMVDDYLVTQRIDEKLAGMSSAAVRMAPLLRDDDADGMYALAVDSAKRTGGRYLVLDTSAVVQADSFSTLNGRQISCAEIDEVLSGDKTQSYGFHRIADAEAPGGYFWSANYTAAVTHDGQTIGALLYADSVQDVVSQTQKLTLGIVLLSVGACLVVIVISLMLSGYITRPILMLRDVAIRIADGHFDQRVRVSGRSEIAQLGEAFNKMSERLENIDIERSEFVSNASHELRTPLSSIKILVESLLYQEKTDEKIRKEFLGDINNEIDRLDHIISDLLSITKIDNAQQPLHVERVSLKKLLNKTAAALMPLADRKKISVEMDAPEDAVAVCDALKIRQAVANLIDNAIKYTGEGGRVSIRLSRSEGSARIDVEDNGPGIPEEHLAHVFERFYRVDKARSRETGGTGLGLYIAKRIVTQHGGTIIVKSREGEGTAFTVILPQNMDEGKDAG